MSLSPISFAAGSPKCNDEPAAGAAASFWKDSEDSIVTEVLEVRQQQMSSFGSNDVEIWGGVAINCPTSSLSKIPKINITYSGTLVKKTSGFY